MITYLLHFFLTLLFGLLLTSTTLSSEEIQKVLAPIEKDPNNEILFGQSAFLSGSFKLYGEFIRDGIQARFNRINEMGGIHGKKLRLISLDDKGEPTLSEKNIKQLNEQYGIDMFIGNMGTRAMFKLLPDIESKKYALFFPWGDDQLLHKESLRYIVKGQGNIRPQLEILAHYVTETLRTNKVAIFSSDGAFDQKNREALVSLFSGKNVIISFATFNRYTMDIKPAAEKLIKADPKIVISLTTSIPTVKLIKYFYESGHYETKFIGIDSTFLTPSILKPRQIPYGYTTNMPNPLTSELSIAKEYREDIKKYFPQDPANVLALSYYLHAAIIEKALKQIKLPITKEKIITAIESMEKTRIGDFELNFNKQNRFVYDAPVTLLS